jgi:hypothetical protein
MERFAACFADLEDQRESNARHLLLDILVIGFCTILCDGEDCSDMALFGRAKEGFLRQFLRLPHGIPSHDTCSRVFRLLDPAQFQACFLRFMADFAVAAGGVMAIDGKTLRRSFDRAAERSPLHLVTAWAADCRLVLGQMATDVKSNEITAVPKWATLDKPSFTIPFNVTGQPAMSVCTGFGEGGLPVAMQLIGRPFDDAVVLRAAHAYEQATDWRNRRPALAA